jgi:hypothetical protein
MTWLTRIHRDAAPTKALELRWDDVDLIEGTRRMAMQLQRVAGNFGTMRPG